MTPLPSKKKFPSSDSSWPRSRDKLYSPSPEAVLQLRDAELAFQETQQLTNEQWRDQQKRLLEEIFLRRERSRIRLRAAVELSKQRKEETKKRQARWNARIYFDVQKEDGETFLKVNLFSYLGESARKLREAQRQDSALFLRKLRQERYFITLLYEDYYLPLNSKKRHTRETLFFENLYRTRFFQQFYRRQRRIFHAFLRKQKSERLLHFLSSLELFALDKKEKAERLRTRKNFYGQSSFHF